MARSCSEWVQELFVEEVRPEAQAAAAAQKPKMAEQELPLDLLEEAIVFARRSLHWVLPSLVTAPIRDLRSLTTNEEKFDILVDEYELIDDDSASSRPSGSKPEAKPGTPAQGLFESNVPSQPEAAPLTTLTIYGLPRKLDVPGLQEAFAAAGFVFGDAIDYALIPKRGISREAGVPCRYAFVNFTSAQLAIQAKAAWDGQQVTFPKYSEEPSCLRVEISKVQGLEENLKMNTTDAWLSTTPPQLASESKGKMSPTTTPMTTEVTEGSSVQTGAGAGAEAVVTQTTGSDANEEEGAVPSESTGGGKKRKKQQNRRKKQQPGQWQGQQ